MKSFKYGHDYTVSVLATHFIFVYGYLHSLRSSCSARNYTLSLSFGKSLCFYFYCSPYVDMSWRGLIKQNSTMSYDCISMLDSF